MSTIPRLLVLDPFFHCHHISLANAFGCVQFCFHMQINKCVEFISVDEVFHNVFLCHCSRKKREETVPHVILIQFDINNLGNLVVFDSKFHIEKGFFHPCIQTNKLKTISYQLWCDFASLLLLVELFHSIFFQCRHLNRSDNNFILTHHLPFVEFVLTLQIP